MKAFYITAMISGGVFGLFSPYFGLCVLIVFSFLCSLLPFYPELTSYHPNLYLSIVISGSCLLRGLTFGTKKLYLFMWLLFLLSVYYSDWTTEFTMRDLVSKSNTEFNVEVFSKLFILNIVIIGFTKTKKQVNLLMLTFMLAGFANTVYAVLQKHCGMAMPSGDLGSIERYSGFQGDANSLCIISMVSIALGFYYMNKTESKLLKIFYLSCFVCSIYSVFLSKSRSGLLGMGLVLGMLALKNIKKPIYTITFIAGLIFTFTYGLDYYSDRPFFEEKKGEKVVENERLTLWGQAIDLFLKYPFKGVGPGNYSQACRKKLNAKGASVGSHNTFLQIFAEQGLLGGIPLVLLFISACKSISRLKRSKDEFYSERAEYFQIGFLGFFFSINFFMFANVPFYWIVLSIPVVTEKIAQQELEDTAEA